MDIFSRFKKDYARYFLGIMIPASINGISIPLLKHLMGAAGYGQYALYFNALLIANVLLAGWLSQSILRFTARAADKAQFAVQSIFIAGLLPFVSFVPAVWIIGQQEGFFFGFLFAATLGMASLQLPLQSLTQAVFLSKKTLVAEAIRTVSWISIALLLLNLQIPLLYSLFTALFVSYTLSAGYLYKSNGLYKADWSLHVHWKTLGKQLLKYGLPLSLWFVFSYLIVYIDKVYMLHRFGAEMQGNYNALFDFIVRGLVLLLAPVLTSAMPLVSEAYEKGELGMVHKLLRKLIVYELVTMVVLVAGYWLIGYRLLFYLLHIPERPMYVAMGICMIVATLTWQVALLAQKPFELRLQGLPVMWRAGIAFSCQLLFYFFTRNLASPMLVPLGYLVAATVYLALVLVSFPVKKQGQTA